MHIRKAHNDHKKGKRQGHKTKDFYMAANFPLVIETCLSLLPGFVTSPFVRFGRPGQNSRAMRSDRQSNFLSVLTVLVKSCSLQHAGLFCHIGDNWARPITVPEIATYCDISEKTVDRIFGDMRALGIVEGKQIKRKNPKTGQLEVSIGLRRFTPKFWELLGLTGFFKDSCEWAKNHARRFLVMPFKGISVHVKKAATATKDLAKPVMKALSEDAKRIKGHCSEILKLVRQRK